jgi:putative endonuclease
MLDEEPLPSMGKRCEALVAGYLQGKGYHLRMRNFRMRQGEIDLVMEEGKTIVFVEVKSRHDGKYGAGSEAVGWRKQRTIMALATIYMARLPCRTCRFDVVSVTVTRGKPAIQHIPNAFP